MARAKIRIHRKKENKFAQTIGSKTSSCTVFLTTPWIQRLLFIKRKDEGVTVNGHRFTREHMLLTQTAILIP